MIMSNSQVKGFRFGVFVLLPSYNGLLINATYTFLAMCVSFNENVQLESAQKPLITPTFYHPGSRYN